MARRKTRTLTEVELEFMGVIWASGGEVTSEDIRKALERLGRRLSDGTVRKVLSILGTKGYVSRRKEGRFFHYKAEVGEGQANRSLVTDLLRRAFGGSATLMVAALLDSREVNRRDVEKIKRLIVERENRS